MVPGKRWKFHLPYSLCIFMTDAAGFPWRSSCELKNEEQPMRCSVRTAPCAERLERAGGLQPALPAPTSAPLNKPGLALDFQSGLRWGTGVKIHLCKGTSEKDNALSGTPAGKRSSEPLCLHPWDRHTPCMAASLPAARGEEVPVEHAKHRTRNHSKAKRT